MTESQKIVHPKLAKNKEIVKNNKKNKSQAIHKNDSKLFNSRSVFESDLFSKSSSSDEAYKKMNSSEREESDNDVVRTAILKATEAEKT